MEPPPAPLDRLPWRRSTFLTALLGWILPGLGQLYVGRPHKALLFLVAILPTFLLGWALTDFTIVNPSKYGLDFVAQVFLGGPVFGALGLTAERTLDHMPRFLDVGRLYVQVAGLLNLVAISDAVGEAIAHNLRVLDRKAERREAAAAAAPAEGTERPYEPSEPVVVPPDPEGRELVEESREWPLFGPHPVREVSDAFDGLEEDDPGPKDEPKEGGGA